MKPLVSIIMGSTSDLGIMRKACVFLDEQEIPFELNALSAHRTPDLVAEYAKHAEERGVRVIIAAAGGAAHLPGVIAASTTLPVIGVPIKSSNSVGAIDSILSILQMPSGIPVATVAVDGATNAAILACQIVALTDEDVRRKVHEYKVGLAKKIEKANNDLGSETYKFRVS